MASYAQEEFFLGFYFWLDLVATLSLISDIGWIWDKMTGTEDVNAGNAEQASQLARAGRGARVGTRAGRIVRIIRLIRLIRIVKLYKHAQKAMIQQQEMRKQHEEEEEHAHEHAINPISMDPNAVQEEEEEVEEEIKVPEESKVGKKLSDLTTRRVILLVLAMMFSVPLFTISTYQEENNSFTFGLELIKAFNDAGQRCGAQTAFESYISEH